MIDVKLYKDISDSSEIKRVEPGTPIYKIISPENKIAIVNGQEKSFDYILKENDVCIVRTIPEAAGLFIAGVFIFIVATVAVGVGMGAYQTAERARKKAENLSDEIENIPYLKGASNAIATGRTQPYIIGRHLFTPYILSQPHYSISGTDGINQYYYLLLEGGFGKQVLEKLYADDILIKTFTGTTPHEGIYEFDAGLFYDENSFIEISQDGSDFATAEFNKKYITSYPANELKKAGDAEYTDLIYQLPRNSRNVSIEINLKGLRAYQNSDGTKINRTVVVNPFYSLDDGETWTSFTFDQNGTPSNTFTRNTSVEMRFTATKEFLYSDVSGIDTPVKIKLVCPTNEYEGTALDSVTVSSIKTLCYDIDLSAIASAFVNEKPIGDVEAALSTRIGICIKATEQNKEKLNKINIITNGIARTWNGSEWPTTRTPTSNLAAWVLEVLGSWTHGPSIVEDSEIDLDKFGEFYEYCETNRITVNMVLTDGDEKTSVLTQLCNIGSAALYENIYGEISLAWDAVKENAIAVLNAQNVLSFEVSREFSRETDGLLLNYICSSSDYQDDSYLIMRDGVTRTSDSIIQELSIKGITDYQQLAIYARRLMAIEKLRRRKIKAQVGKEGLYYTPLEKLLVQHPALSIGLGSAEIKSTIIDGDNIIGVELYEQAEYNSGEAAGYGVIIQSVSDTYCTPISAEYTALTNGRVTVIYFETPIALSATAIPHAGDILSWGLLNAGEFDLITSEMLISGIASNKNGYEIDLVDYNAAIYESGTIPDYTPMVAYKSKASIAQEINSQTIFDEAAGATAAAIAAKAAAQSLALSGPTLFAYASGATVPVPTNVTLTATPQAFTATAYQWQYYAEGWTNLSDESGKVSGAATANLTIYYNATVWGTAKTLRLRCVANSAITKEISLAKIADGQGSSIKGTVAEPTDLADIVAPSVGDIYSVGSAGTYGGVTYDAGDGARWDGSAWVNIGAIQGPAGLNAPRYLGVGLLAADDNATFRLDTVDVDGDITTGTNVTAITSDLMVNHHSSGAAIALCRWSGTEWVATTEAKDLDLAATDIRNLATGRILIPGITVLKAAIVNSLQTETVKFEQSVSADKRATAGVLTAGDSRIAMGYDPGVPRWTAGNVVALGYIIREDGNVYVCSTAGTTGSTAPTWPSSGTVSDNTAVWTYASAAEYEFAVSKYLGAVGGNEVWQKQFLTKALRSGLIGLLLIGGLESCAPIYSDPGRVWYRQESGFGDSDVRSVAYGNGKLVAVGWGGKIAYSSNGETWTLVTSSPFGTTIINGVAYGNGKWVAVGLAGKIAYSSNGETWTLVTSSPFGTTIISGVAYGNGKWVAVGEGGEIAYSSNGEAWTLVTSSPFGTSRVLDVTCGNGKWVAVGFVGKIAYSSNGETWTLVTSSPFGTSDVFAVAYGNGKWVAVGLAGKIAYSSNGETWTLVTSSPFGTTIISGVAYGNGKWVAVGQGGKIAYSYSAEEWVVDAESPYGADGYFFGATYSTDQNRWVAVGYLASDNSGIIITSDYLESGMGFTSRTIDANGRAYYSLQDGARLYDGRGAVGAFARINMRATVNKSVSYTQTGTVVTVTLPNHRLVVDHPIYLQISSGGLPSAGYTVSSVVNANQFTVAAASATRSGAGALRLWEILAATGNVVGATYSATGDGYLLLDEPVPVGCVQATAGDLDANYQAQSAWISPTKLRIRCVTAESNSYANSNNFNVTVFV